MARCGQAAGALLRAMAGLVPLKRGAVRVPAAGVVYMCPTPCIAKFGLSLS